jgi:hypothetical protein
MVHGNSNIKKEEEEEEVSVLASIAVHHVKVVPQAGECFLVHM